VSGLRPECRRGRLHHNGAGFASERLLAAAAIVAALGAVQQERAEVVRFEIETTRSGTSSATAYVLDAATGQVWASQRVEFFNPKIGVAE
jgi:hypothetical protein